MKPVIHAELKVTTVEELDAFLEGKATPRLIRRDATYKGDPVNPLSPRFVYALS